MGSPTGDRTWLWVLLILLWIVVQFGLAAWALHDLWRRPRVRGDNKVVWALAILILPVIGPLVYSSFGPTSFLPRRSRQS